MRYLFSASILLCIAWSASAQHAYKILNTFHIASPGGWDYLAVNDDKLYISHGAQVNILNKKTGDSIGVIPHTTGVHGIAFVESLHKGFVSNGRLNNVTVFDLLTGAPLQTITTGENPDAIVYEEFSKTIITCNGKSKSLSLLDPKTGKVVATIPLQGKPEEAASDNEGSLYVNIQDKNEVAEVDMRTFKVLHYWPITADGPTGLALDRKSHMLFAGCDKMLVVMNASTGKQVTTVPIGEGCDGVVFDAASKNIYTSNGEGTITVIHVDNGSYKVVDNIPTKPGARTIAIDKKTHLLYLPTAEFEPAAADAPQHTRPTMKAGTFQVLVVGPQ